MNRQIYRIGTRGSQLALVQAESIAHALRQQHIPSEIVIISTKGDRERDVKLSSLGGVGAFTKEIQHALLERQVDLAVHSLKDLPTVSHAGLRLAAVPPRVDVHDIAVLHPQYSHWDALPPNAIIGTGSLRRAAQLAHQSPLFQIHPIRGNVETRLRKLDQHTFDAIILAAAGLGRLGYQERIAYTFPSQILCPAAGQGAIGIEIRDDDVELQRALDAINHPQSMVRVTAERALLRTLGAGCSAPVGTLAEIHSCQHVHDNSNVSCDDHANHDDRTSFVLTWRLTLHARVLSQDGKVALEMKDSAPLDGFEGLLPSGDALESLKSTDQAKGMGVTASTTEACSKDAFGATPSAWLNTAEKLGTSVAQRLIQLGAESLLNENHKPIV